MYNRISVRSLGLALTMVVAIITATACGPTTTPEPTEPTSAPSVEATEVEAVTSVAEPTEVIEEVEEESIVIVAMAEEPATFDYPHFPVSRQTDPLLGMVLEGLALTDKNGLLQPLLAESWEISDDGLTWTFHLRQGINFHDGTPFNSEAVSFHVNRLISEEDPILGVKALNQFAYSAITEVNIVDDYTIQFKTDDPFAPLINSIHQGRGGIASPTAVKELGENFGEHPIGTGAYKLVEWVRGERIVFERNPDYWGGGERADIVIVRIVPDATTRVLGLLAGDFNITPDVPPEQVEQVRSNPGTDVLVVESNRAIWLIPNLREASPLSNILVREAIDYAIDRDAVVEFVMGGLATRADTILSPLTPGYLDLPELPYDPARSIELLGEAGYPNGFSAKMAHAPWVPKDQEVSEAVQGFLAEIGIELELVALEPGDYWASMGERPEEFDLWLFAWGPSTADADAPLRGTHHTDSIPVYNSGNYSDPEMDRLIDLQRSTMDFDERVSVLQEILRRVREEHSGIPLFYQRLLVAVTEDVQNFIVTPVGMYFQDVDILN